MFPDDQKLEPEDPRVRLAGERTLLAWIRTGLAMMGFGFVVARFGLFLREIASVQAAPLTHHTGLSVWIGTVLVLLGVLVNLAAAWQHFRLLRQIDRRQPYTPPRWSLGIILAVTLATLGMGTAVYLVVLGY